MTMPGHFRPSALQKRGDCLMSHNYFYKCMGTNFKSEDNTIKYSRLVVETRLDQSEP
jgi:hypothetical protein